MGKGKVGVVLGAGNAGFLSIVDALHLLFERNMVVFVKHADVRRYNHLYFDVLFEPLIRRGFVASFSGGRCMGSHIVYHDAVGHVHMTGGKATHDAIVWGSPGAERERRIAEGDPKLRVPMTSELGCVTPYIIAPAKFSPRELRHHAKHLCIAFIANISCNCVSPKVLVLEDGRRCVGGS